MIYLELFGDLVPYAPPRRCGRVYFDPKSKEKDQLRWQIKAQYREQPISGAYILDFTFLFPIPKDTSKVRRKQMLMGVMVPIVKPDCSNLLKTYEDCLKGIVIEDDRQVCEVNVRKRYSEKPGAIIRIMTFTEKYGTAGC